MASSSSRNLRSGNGLDVCLQDCVTYKSRPPDYSTLSATREHLKSTRRSKRMRTQTFPHPIFQQACQLTYAQIPSPIKLRFPLQSSNNESGYKQVHRTTNGNYQVQVWCKSRNKLVHQGIYKDRQVAALAASIARTSSRIASVEHQARELIEQEFAKYVQQLRTSGVSAHQLANGV